MSRRRRRRVVVVVVVDDAARVIATVTGATNVEAHVERKDNIETRSLSNLGSKSLRRHARYASRGV